MPAPAVSRPWLGATLLRLGAVGGLLAWLPIVSPRVAAAVGSPSWRNRRHCRYTGAPGICCCRGLLLRLTALADDAPMVLSAPYPQLAVSGLGRLVEVVHQRGPAGDFLNVTWPGFTGVLTAVAPGRFAASINQAPMRRRTTAGWLLWLDYALNAVSAFISSGRPPPEHSLRIAFERCATFDEACRFLETTPVARPVLFLVQLRAGDACCRTRGDDARATATDGRRHEWRIVGGGGHALRLRHASREQRRRVAAMAPEPEDIPQSRWATASRVKRAPSRRRDCAASAAWSSPGGRRGSVRVTEVIVGPRGSPANDSEGRDASGPIGYARFLRRRCVAGAVPGIARVASPTFRFPPAAPGDQAAPRLRRRAGSEDPVGVLMTFRLLVPPPWVRPRQPVGIPELAHVLKCRPVSPVRR